MVLLTMDELPLDSLIGPNGAIDAERYPNFAALAATSVWYPNATTVHDNTIRAVPAILDGRLPRPEASNTLATYPQNAFTLLGDAGYRVVASEEATSMCPPRLCPRARRAPAGIRELLSGGRPERFARWLRTIRPGPATFYYKHLLLPHGPRKYLPSGKMLAPSRPGPIRALTTPRGFFDPALTVANRARFLLQLAYTDRLLGRLVRRLRRKGMFDRAIVVVTADHGIASDVGVETRRTVNRDNIDEIAPVPLFFKLPEQRQPHVGLAYMRTVDILPTLAGVLRLQIPWPHEGRPVWHWSVRERRDVTLIARDFSGTVQIDSDTLLRRRRANIHRAWRLFGTGAQSRRVFGSPYAELYRVGPNPGLIGRETDSLAAGPSRARAELPDAAAWRSVDRFSPVVPAKVAGTISGGGRSSTRDLAVAFNGRVWAVGRSVRLRGGSPELFSVLVPEEALREGRNVVRVYEVARRGARLVLRRLRAPGS